MVQLFFTDWLSTTRACPSGLTVKTQWSHVFTTSMQLNFTVGAHLLKISCILLVIIHSIKYTVPTEHYRSVCIELLAAVPTATVGCS